MKSWKRHEGSHPGGVAAGRIPELDGLRGLAALGIVLYHSNPKRLPAGWAAVDLFFVLSGFLITSIILRHGREAGFLRNFYMRRGLRIWPIYFLTIGAFVLLNPFLPSPCNWKALPFDLTYTQTMPLYWSAKMQIFSRYLRHTWTLAVEEQFYLIWPVLVLLVGRRGVIPLSLATVAGAVLARSQGLSLMLLASRADGLAMGGLLAALLQHAPAGEREMKRRLGGLGVCVLTGVAGLVALGTTVGLRLPQGPPPWPALSILAFNLTWFGVVGVAAVGTGQGWISVLRWPRLRWLGQVSYGLYLYHLPIMILSGDIARGFGLRGQPFWREGPTLALCFVAAALSWRYVEEPILRLKSRFEYRHLPKRGLEVSPRAPLQDSRQAMASVPAK